MKIEVGPGNSSIPATPRHPPPPPVPMSSWRKTSDVTGDCVVLSRREGGEGAEGGGSRWGCFFFHALAVRKRDTRRYMWPGFIGGGRGLLIQWVLGLAGEEVIFFTCCKYKM